MRHDAHAYDELMHGPRHVSKDRPHMSNYDRAAQFAPFAALTGFDGEIEETARLTSGRPELDEDEKYFIDRSLQNIRRSLEKRPNVILTVFVPDSRKEGGALVEHAGAVIGINEYARTILLESGASVNIDDIVSIRQADQSS